MLDNHREIEKRQREYCCTGNSVNPRLLIAPYEATGSFVMFPVHKTALYVLHVKPFFLPVDIQHTHCPCRFFLLERCKLCGHENMIQGYYIVVQ